MRGQRGDVDVVDEHFARIGAVEAAEDPQRGGFAAARRPEQSDQLTLVDLEIQTVECAHVREMALNAFEANHQNTRLARPARRLPTNESENRSTKVKISEMFDSATAMPAVPARLCWMISTGNVV